MSPVAEHPERSEHPSPQRQMEWDAADVVESIVPELTHQAADRIAVAVLAIQRAAVVRLTAENERLTAERNTIEVAAVRSLKEANAENERLRTIAKGAEAELRAEHQSEEKIDGCVMCWPKDGHWPCTSALIADDLAAAALPGVPEPDECPLCHGAGTVQITPHRAIECLHEWHDATAAPGVEPGHEDAVKRCAICGDRVGVRGEHYDKTGPFWCSDEPVEVPDA